MSTKTKNEDQKGIKEDSLDTKQRAEAKEIQKLEEKIKKLDEEVKELKFWLNYKDSEVGRLIKATNGLVRAFNVFESQTGEYK